MSNHLASVGKKNPISKGKHPWPEPGVSWEWGKRHYTKEEHIETFNKKDDKRLTTKVSVAYKHVISEREGNL